MTELVQAHLREYEPSASVGFRPERVILTRGALDTLPRRVFAERLLRLFPDAERIEALDRTHMQLGGLLPKGDAARRSAGRRTLVLGTIASPLRQSRETNIVCPNYLHFSPSAYCSYGCAYCYLAGSCSTVVAPVTKVFVNLEDILAAIARRAQRLTEPTSFYLGKLQDALALDPLTGFSRVLVPFFAGQPLARLVMLTKSDSVGNLLAQDHHGHTAVSWSVNPEAVCREFEAGAPPLERRLGAARLCQQAGFPIRFIIMPILPVDDWQRHYGQLVEGIFAACRPERITLGGICSYGTALRLTKGALGADNLIARHVSRQPCADGRRRFSRELRAALYSHIIAEIRRHEPDIPVALCLEELELWRACGLDPFASLRAGPARPACNCVW
jgi:spore photoproduct lyase